MYTNYYVLGDFQNYYDYGQYGVVIYCHTRVCIKLGCTIIVMKYQIKNKFPFVYSVHFILFAVCILFCLQCVFYFVCSVHFILFAVCILFCLQCAFYFVCSVHNYFACSVFILFAVNCFLFAVNCFLFAVRCFCLQYLFCLQWCPFCATVQMF